MSTQQSIVKSFQQDFEVTGGGNQVLGVAHTLTTNGQSARIRAYANAQDTTGDINFAQFAGEFVARRIDGTVSLTEAWTQLTLVDNNGGNVTLVNLEVNGDDIRVEVGFGGWTSGTQYATARARVEIDIL
jgi:hypothetical protein